MSGYAQSDGQLLEALSTTHKNDEKTHVIVLDVGDTHVAMAVDTDGAGEVLATEVIEASLTPDEAVERARRWAEDNPKGVKGDSGLASILG